MSYSVKYINCGVCGCDSTKILGIRGNLEYSGAPKLPLGAEHIVTNVVRCRQCGFVYTNPLIMQEGRLGRYDNPQIYKPSADNTDPRFLFSATLKHINKFVLRGNILDVGCGKGEFLAVAKENGWEVYGVEPSREFAEYANKKHGLNIRSSTCENTGFPGGFFDVATLNMALEHIDSPQAAIKEVNRVLKTEGVLLIEVPNTDSLMLKLAGLYFRLKGKYWSPLLSPLHYPFHCYGYNRASLKYLLNSCNFKILKVIVSDSSLRGIRNQDAVGWLERWLCRLATKISGSLGMGDILTVIAVKKNDL